MSSRSYSCEYCGAMFNNRSNKYRHEKQYCPSTRTKKKSDHVKVSKMPKTKKIKRTIPKKKIEVKVKIRDTSATETESNKNLIEEINNLRERVQKMENKPVYNNWIIIGPDMFTEMIEKYGRTEALDYLTKSAISGDSVDVVKKLYLDGVSPEKYPIACKNYHHFRYLNDKREIIDDQGGQSVRKIFSDRAHKAMVLATNEMMNVESDKDAGDMYRKLGDVQCRLSSVHTLDLDRLAHMTINPNHPFFLDEGEY